MVVSKSLRSLLIINTIIVGLMFTLVIMLFVILNLPSTTNQTVLASIAILDLAIILYKSLSNLDEFSKNFEGLGSGIAGCIFSALGIGMLMWFVTTSDPDFFVYLVIFTYTMIIGILYIILNELHRKKRTGG